MIRHKLTYGEFYRLLCGVKYEFGDKTKYAWFWKDVTCEECLKLRKVER